jgi:hypothetical protein
MSLFIKTHWMAGRQAGRQAGKQVSTGAGKERKARQGKSEVIQATTLTIISVNDGGST